MLAAVGVVSPSNAPLWLRCYHPTEEPRRLHTVLHCALDGVDERLGAPGGTKDTGAAYLGLLSPRDEYLVYGYVSCTRVKLLLAFDGPEARETEVREAFKRLHAAYMDAVCNPFQGHGQPLRSAAFDQMADRIARQLRGAAPRAS